ncbi:MAG: alpha/beta hydrolase [Gordonia sp. (in: high G+C Gram-positive bacteria)]
MTESHLIEVRNGVRLSAGLVGDGPAVLLNGGMGMPGTTWQLTGLPDLLVERGFSVLTYSARGVSPSDAPPPPYSIPEMADDAASLVTYFGIDDVVVVGYSMGCYVTQALVSAALAGGRTTINGVAMIAGLRSSAIGELVNEMQLDLIDRLGEVPSHVATFETLMTTLGVEQLQDAATVRAWRSILTESDSSYSSDDGRHGQVAASHGWMTAAEPTPERLAGIDVPALVVAYQDDLFFPPATSREAAALLPQSEFVQVDGLTHGGLILDPARTVNPLVADFCERVAATPLP